MPYVCADKFPKTGGFYMDPLLKANIDDSKIDRQNDWDTIGLCSGMEGSGKTTFVQQVCYYADISDTPFNFNKVCGTPEDFLRLLDELPKGSSIQYDEGITGIERGKTVSTVFKIIKAKLTLIRKKCFFIIICIPDFFDIGSYLADRRAVFLLYVEAKYNPENNVLERGFFRFYSQARMRKLSLLGRKDRNMNAVRCNFSGRFHDFWVIDREKYEKLKEKMIESIGFESSLREEVDKKDEEKKEIAVRMALDENCPLTQTQIASYFGVCRRTLANWIASFREREKKSNADMNNITDSDSVSEFGGDDAQ